MTKKQEKRGYGNGNKRRNITIDDNHKKYLESLSSTRDNLSEGIRTASDFHKKNSKKKKVKK